MIFLRKNSLIHVASLLVSYALPLLTLTGGCADVELDSASGTTADETASTLEQTGSRAYDVLKLRPTIKIAPDDVRTKTAAYSGSLCPFGSVDSSSSDAEGTFGFRFGDTRLDNVTNRPVSGSCRMDFDVTIPPGLSFSKPLVQVYMTNIVPSSSSRTKVSVRYAVNNGPWLNGASRTMDDPQTAAYSLIDHPSLAGSSCGATAPRTMRISVEVLASLSGRGTLTVNIVEGSFNYLDGIEWTACPGYTLIKPEGRKKNEQCDENSRCATGLQCEQLTGNRGICVNPKERVAPVKLGERCGGLRNVACAAPAVCHYANDANKLNDAPGFCRLKTSRKGEVCGGIPNITCSEPGLMCRDERCTDISGDARIPLGGSCSEGKGVCQAQLSCVAHDRDDICEHPLVFIGEACDPAAFRNCQGGLTCEAGKCAPRNPGAANSRCRPGIDACNPGLVCNAIRKACVPG